MPLVRMPSVKMPTQHTVERYLAQHRVREVNVVLRVCTVLSNSEQAYQVVEAMMTDLICATPSEVCLNLC